MQTYDDALNVAPHNEHLEQNKTLKMANEPIGQRIKFLITSLNLSVRKFAHALDVGETNIRNYLDRGTKPSSDVLEKIIYSFPQVNITWLLTGEGEPFLPGTLEASILHHGNFNQVGTRNKQTIKGNSGTIQNNTGSGNTINNLTLDDCKRDLQTAQREIEHLTERLKDKEELLKAREDTIKLLRASVDRSN